MLAVKLSAALLKSTSLTQRCIAQIMGGFMLFRREVHLVNLFWLAFGLVLGLPILTSFFQAGSTI